MEDKIKANIVLKEPDAVVYGARLFSYADYLGWKDDKMREIINGIVFSFSAPLREHASATIAFLKNCY